MSFMQKSPTGCRPDNLIGAWFIEPSVFDALYQQVSSIDLFELARMNSAAEQEEKKQNGGKTAAERQPAYTLKNDVAVIEVKGPTTRYPSSYQRLIGGTSTLMVEKALDKASRDPHVKGILMHYETPGGTVAGSAELVDAIQKAKKLKPVWSHGTDLVASAGMLYGTQGDRFSTNRTAELGSMGTRAVLVDKSEQAAKLGVKVIPIVAGKFKAAGLPGTPVTEEQVEYFEERIKAHNDRYVKDIADARGVEAKTILDMEAKVFDPVKALELKLIDKICSFDETLSDFSNELRKTDRGTSSGKQNPPASRSRNMLTAEQIAQARQLPGAANVSEENADVVLLGVSAALQNKVVEKDTKISQLADELVTVKSKVPKEPDLDILNEAADNAFASIDNMLEAEQIMPEQVKILKNAIRPTLEGGKPGTPNAFLLQKAEGGKRVYQQIFDAFKLNKPMGVVNELSDAQPVQQPGQNGGEAKTLEQAALAVVGAHGKRNYGHLAPAGRNGHDDDDNSGNGNNGNGRRKGRNSNN